MEEETVNGIVLRAAPFKESSAVLTLLTAEHGRLPVVAQGVRKTKKSGLFAQPFSYSEFVLCRGQGMYICRSAELKEAFYNLRSDMERLAAGQYLLEVSALAGEEIPDGSDYLRLLLNSLYLLSRPESGVSPATVKCVFELKFAQLSGYADDAGTCAECGGASAYWSFEDGFLCEKCAESRTGDIYPLSPAVRQALIHILSCDGKNAYSFRMSEAAFGKLAFLTEKYLSEKTETRFRTLEFYSKNGSERAEKENKDE